MAGLEPAIYADTRPHQATERLARTYVDGRLKAGHDGKLPARCLMLAPMRPLPAMTRMSIDEGGGGRYAGRILSPAVSSMLTKRITRRRTITAALRGTGAIASAEAFVAGVTPRKNLVAFMQGLGIGDLDVTREPDIGRDIALDGHGARLAAHLRGRGDVAMSTDAMMALTRHHG